MSSVFDGLHTREQLKEEIKKSTGREPCDRTIRRWEVAGLPVIRRGTLRLYDVEKTRSWLRGELNRSDRGRRRGV